MSSASLIEMISDGFINLAVIFVVTNDIDSTATPPDEGIWSAVSRSNGRTVWRKIELSDTDVMIAAE